MIRAGSIATLERALYELYEAFEIEAPEKLKSKIASFKEDESKQMREMMNFTFKDFISSNLR
jgi:hypothetical protein